MNVLRGEGKILDLQGRPMASECVNQLLVDSIPALIHKARPDGHLDYFNKPWLEYLGVTLDASGRRKLNHSSQKTLAKGITCARFWARKAAPEGSLSR